MENKELNIIIENKIFIIRGRKIMLSTHLADLYVVAPRSLIQSVKRNLDRFPEDFMFQLTNKEYEDLKSQFVISSWGGSRHPPYAFTEHGIVMLSSILNSPRAIQMNIFIIRAFIKMRELVATNKDIVREIDKIKRKQEKQGSMILSIYSVIRRLTDEPVRPKGKIGFGEVEKED